ncbi:serine hydrolase [Ahniella affigens]|nr:serine hydrolase [Ahniella affigens]
MRPILLTFALAAMALVTFAADAEPLSIDAILSARFDGDRSGACVLAAQIDGDRVETGKVCADPERARNWNADTSFEIGSISKTFNGLMLAQAVAAGTISLDDPIAKHLPKRTNVPTFDGQPIRIRHLLTHTAGLPSLPLRFAPKKPDNPYADLSDAVLIGSLADLKLSAAPGTNWAYSNWGAMLLSHILAHHAKTDYPTAMQKTLFEPIGMTSASLGGKRKGVKLADGHLSSGAPTAHWDFPDTMGGVGAVRASLHDLIAYAKAELHPDSVPALSAALTESQELLSTSAPQMAWGWIVRDTDGGRRYAHEGGTGGFSSLLMFEPKRGRATIVLSDAALTDVGGLGQVAMAIDQGTTEGLAPRREIAADAELLKALTGDWLISGALPAKLWVNDGNLVLQAQGQSAFELGHDSAGAFFVRPVDAVLVPVKAEDGTYSLRLHQGGGVVPVTRVKAPEQVVTLDAAALAAYVGKYPLAPNFVLSVFVDQGQLMAQATGQGAFALTPEGQDVFTARAFGIEIQFNRAVDGSVKSLNLKQGGANTPAEKQ